MRENTPRDEIRLGRLFFNVPTATLGRHPHIVASDPARDPARVVVVNLSSQPCLGDVSYTVEPGEHPAVSHQSFIRCDFAEVTTLDRLYLRLDRREISASSTLVSDHTLSKVWRALAESRRPPREVQAVLREQGYIK